MASTLTWQQLRDLNLSRLTEAADGWAGASRHADSAREQIDNRATRPLARTQESESASAAVKRLRRLGENFSYIHTECGLVRGAVDGLACELSSQRQQLIQALEDAAVLGYTVNANGSVSYPPGRLDESAEQDVAGGTAYGHNGRFDASVPAPSSPGSHGVYVPGQGNDRVTAAIPNPHYAKAKDIADRLSMALFRAQEIDDRYSSTLEKLKARPGLAVDRRTWADAGADIGTVGASALPYLRDHVPLDKSPAERKKWWDHLTAEEKQEYLSAFPELIGNLDGIPATVRDEANRENIKVIIAQLEGQHDNLSRAQLEGLKGIQKKLNESSNPPMFLLGVGTQGNGRAIVSYGNPDTSRHVSAYVPGLGTTLDGEFVNDTVRRAHQTAKGAYKFDSSVASIVWLGYDAPGFTDVASTADAEKGAPDYVRFMDGLKATNTHKDPHVTAIGHSYGSLLVGTAARRDGGIPGADDIVLLGSPGTGAQTAGELHVPQGHVFAASAGNDPVSWLPAKSSLIGPAPATVNALDDERWFGRDPVSKEFGAVRIKSGDGPLPLGLSGQGLTPAHSGYFDTQRNPSSADNIARVVGGRPELVEAEEPR